MGAYHAESLARRIPGVRLAAIADPAPGRAERLAAQLGCDRATLDYRSVLDDPSVDGIVIAVPARYHAQIIIAAAEAGKAVFCEKPITHDLAEADRAIDAAHTAGVPLQIGFQRRFAAGYVAAHDLVARGELGTPQLLRSLTRDPELEQPERVAPWAVFLETLIHDFDVVRWLSAAEPLEVFATADALVRPDLKDRGLLDTAVATVRFSNGALATVDASFRAVYGYDVRAEVFGSAGMALIDDPRPVGMTHYGSSGMRTAHARTFLTRFGGAYTAELAHFAECVRSGRAPAVTGADGRAALAIARAAIRSCETGRSVRIAEIDPARAN